MCDELIIPKSYHSFYRDLHVCSESLQGIAASDDNTVPFTNCYFNKERIQCQCPSGSPLGWKATQRLNWEAACGSTARIHHWSGCGQIARCPKAGGWDRDEHSCSCLRNSGDWEVADQVKGVCFDTTSANTGHQAGACTLLEQKLEISLTSLADTTYWSLYWQQHSLLLWDQHHATEAPKNDLDLMNSLLKYREINPTI